MLTLKINYWDRVSYTSCNSEIKKTEELSAETEDALFEIFYKKNNRLQQCNGAYYKFDDKADQSRYQEWIKNLSHDRSFNLYYGGGVVD